MNCTAFNPASMTLTGANTPSPPVTVTVTTQAGSTTTGMIRRTPGIFASLWFAVPAILLIGPRRYGKFSKAKVLQALGLSLVLLLLLYASGCGGGFTPVKATGATPPGTYNLLVQGTGSDGATYSAIVPVNVPR
jgi:hypothetical protein